MIPVAVAVVALGGGMLLGFGIGWCHRGDVEAGRHEQSIKDIKRGRLVIDPRAWRTK